MTAKTIAPYGCWESELTSKIVTAGSKVLSSPRVCSASRRSFFLASRNDGNNSIVEITTDGNKNVLPEGYGASNTVYSYGCLPYAIIPGNELRIIFSDAVPGTLNILNVDTGKVETIIKSNVLQYADFDPHPFIADGSEEHGWVLALEEDRTHPKPADVKNYVVAINVVTKQIKRVVKGADFYSYARFSPDGMKVVFRQWNHPDLPFSGVQLFWGDWEVDSITKVELVAGEDRMCVAEPRWAPNGTLLFAMEKTGFRQLFKREMGCTECKPVKLEGLEEYEFGDASWFPGCQTYAFLDEKSVVAAPLKFGTSVLVHIDLEKEAWVKLDVPFCDMLFDRVERLSPTSALVIAAGYCTPTAVYRVDLAADLTTTIALIGSSVTTTYPETFFSVPESMRFKATKGVEREVHGFFWPPHNTKFEAPSGTLPPLIINPHGGPTRQTTPGLNMEQQYYTSRGYAVLGINYTGSSGFGKAYREALFGRWGLLDRDDVVEAVDYLVKTGRVDGRRIGIEGASAGGYNVSQSLCWYPNIFAAGISYCGLCDLRPFTEEIHKLEMHYIDILCNLTGISKGEKAKVLMERSPIFYVTQITAPLLLFHGSEDKVVPIHQSEEIRDKIQERGGDVKMIVLPGEGHGWKFPTNKQTYVEECEKWWQKTLLKELPETQ